MCIPTAVPVPGPTAFVLGGGGLLGTAEVGMLKALAEKGVTPDLVVGSSVGALNGAFLAARPGAETVEQMMDAWRGLSGRGVFGGTLAGQIGNLVRHGTYLHDNSGLRRVLEENLGDVEFADMAALREDSGDEAAACALRTAIFERLHAELPRPAASVMT